MTIMNGLSNKQTTTCNYKVKVTKTFVALSVILPAIISFCLGNISRGFLLHYVDPSSNAGMMIRPPAGDSVPMKMNDLPLPVFMADAEDSRPITNFTSKSFPVDGVLTSNSIHAQKTLSPDVEFGMGEAFEEDDEEDDDDEDETNMTEKSVPVGQHLIMDLKNVQAEFLNSERRLAQAMIDTIDKAPGLSMLSYHCHSFVPFGVSCVGVMSDRSHMSFHTWPDDGVITLDLFSCVPKQLLPVAKILEESFSVPRQHEAGEYPQSVWMFKERGFPSEITSLLVSRDVFNQVLDNNRLEVREKVLSVQTDFQSIDIWDILDPKVNSYSDYSKSISKDGSYQSNNPLFYNLERILYMDGVEQSTSLADEPYHETLVQPGMFAHPNPKRAAIIGGGEGATLREVLKHKTIEHVKMIEIDPGIITASKIYLKSCNDCSNLIGSSSSCYDDPRASILTQDALAWFIDNASKKEEVNGGFEIFDIIISDALDPQESIEFAEILYTNFEYTNSLYNSLTNDGILIIQVGESPSSSDVPEFMERNQNRKDLMELLGKVGFETILTYEDGHHGFEAPWSFIIVCKDATSCRQSWYKNQAQIEIDIHRRMIRTYSGESPLKYYDGLMQETFQIVPKSWEVVRCRDIPTPADCSVRSYVKSDSTFDVHPISYNLAKLTSDNIEKRGKVLFESFIRYGKYTIQKNKKFSERFKNIFRPALERVGALYH